MKRNNVRSPGQGCARSNTGTRSWVKGKSCIGFEQGKNPRRRQPSFAAPKTAKWAAAGGLGEESQRKRRRGCCLRPGSKNYVIEERKEKGGLTKREEIAGVLDGSRRGKNTTEKKKGRAAHSLIK